MTEKDLDEFKKEFGFKLLPTGFKKPLSEITKEEYRERIEYLYNAIINVATCSINGIVAQKKATKNVLSALPTTNLKEGCENRKMMSKVELRLNVLIEAYKNKMDEIRKLNELEKAFLDDELEVNHNEQMFTQFKGIDKYDFELMVLEQIVESLEYVKTGERKMEEIKNA